MKSKEFKFCFDSLTPDAEQKERMLKNILNAKPRGVLKVKFRAVASASLSVAALAALVAFSFINTSDKAKSPILEAPYGGAVTARVTEKSDVTAPAEDDADNGSDFYESKFAVALTEENMAQNAYVSKDEDTKKEQIADDSAVLPAAGGGAFESYADTPYAARAVAEDFAVASDNAKNEYFSSEDYDEYVKYGHYGEYLPQTFPEGYDFSYACEDGETFFADFKNGEKMLSVSVGLPDSDTTVIDPQNIESREEHGQSVTFTVDCEDAYVTYTVLTEDMENIYETVVSSDYFKQK